MKIINWVRKGLGTHGLYKKLEENNRILHELNWASVFNNTISDSEWLKDKSFSPGRSAIGYPLLYVLYRVLNETRPRLILEFGLGESSNMLYRYAAHYKNVQVTTIEHDTSWVDFFNKKMNKPTNAEIVLVDNIITKYNGVETLSISGLKAIVRQEKFNLILVDAPFGSERYSRSQVISLIPKNIDTGNFCIIIDDYDRPGEKETCIEIEKFFSINGVDYQKGVYRGLKASALYCSSNLKFLKTL